MALPTEVPPFDAALSLPRRLYHQNLSFLRDKQLRAIFRALGSELCFGWPKSAQDGVLVWGASPTAYRGEAVAKRSGSPIIRLEDAFLRSIHPGRMGEPALGLHIDSVGLHFDATAPSRLEQILRYHPLNDPALLERAQHGIARLKHQHLSKYNAHHMTASPPSPSYVLVVDQVQNDASLRSCAAGQAEFDNMLAQAKRDHPSAQILIKSHPETLNGLRKGHYSPAHCDANTTLYTKATSPWALLDGAIAVYTISSQLGFEAILAGKSPHVWGTPFYAGWGLSHDRHSFPRRDRLLSPQQLFAAAMLLAPIWFDQNRQRLCSFEEAVNQLEARVRSFHEDQDGYISYGIRLWKRNTFQKIYGQYRPIRFYDTLEKAQAVAQQTQRPLLIWANKSPSPPLAQSRLCEDGFLRSRGLGANLIAPLSLVSDDLGIYYDPRHASRMEWHLSQPMPDYARKRAQDLLFQIKTLGLSKYNLGASALSLPERNTGQKRILVPGQVSDDASILWGAGEVRDNLDLLKATRAANPSAYLIWKPHPDVEAGLRKGAISPSEALLYADMIANHSDISSLISQIDEVWTMTSLTGFEALLRGKTVTTLGQPFYAGWGLTHDLSPQSQRRSARPDLLHLTYASLIAYPRYWDPISKSPCPPEVVIERLARNQIPKPNFANRLLAKLQGALANHAHLWR